MKIAKYIGAAASVLLLAWASWTCKDDITGGDLNDIVFPDSNVSYTRHVEQVFLRVCAIPQCHTSDARAGNLSLETYIETRERLDVIIPGNPDASLLVQSIEGRAPGSERMPLGLPPLNENQTKGIRRWIQEGAQNN